MDTLSTWQTRRVGMVLYGFCAGYFGRNVDWGRKLIEGEGRDWIVVRDDEGRTWFAQFSGPEQKDEEVARWLLDTPTS